MVCDGRVGGIGNNPQAPYLNKNQKGVHGLQDALSRTSGQAKSYKINEPNKDLFLYLAKDPKEGTSDLSVVVDRTTGVREYEYGAKDSTGNYTRVKAYDFDGDGNIDQYKYSDKADGFFEKRVFSNPSDDGSSNFQMKIKGFSWNPLNWFK